MSGGLADRVARGEGARGPACTARSSTSSPIRWTSCCTPSKVSRTRPVRTILRHTHVIRHYLSLISSQFIASFESTGSVGSGRIWKTQDEFGIPDFQMPDLFPVYFLIIVMVYTYSLHIYLFAGASTSPGFVSDLSSNYIKATITRQLSSCSTAAGPTRSGSARSRSTSVARAEKLRRQHLTRDKIERLEPERWRVCRGRPKCTCREPAAARGRRWEPVLCA